MFALFNVFVSFLFFSIFFTCSKLQFEGDVKPL